MIPRGGEVKYCCVSLRPKTRTKQKDDAMNRLLRFLVTLGVLASSQAAFAQAYQMIGIDVPANIDIAKVVPFRADAFGNVVALSGDGNTIAVGAWFEDSNATGINNNQNNDTYKQRGKR